MDFKSLVNRLDQLSEAKKAKQEIDEETKETSTGRVHKAKPGGYGRAFDTDEEGDEKKDDKKAKPAVKRRRGRPDKDADSTTGEVKKFDTSALSGHFGGKLPGDASKSGRTVSKMASAEKAVSAYNKMREKDKSHAEALRDAAEKYGISQSTLNRYIEDEKLDEVAPPGAKAEKASKKTKLKDWIDYIDENMLAENEQITVQPAKSSTHVIKQGTETLGTVSNPQLAQQIKQSIGKGEMSLAGSELGEDGMGKNYNSGEDKEAQDWLKDPKLETQVLKLIAYGIKINAPEKGIKGIGQTTGLGKEYYDTETTASNPMYFKEFLKYLIKNGYRYKVKGIPTQQDMAEGKFTINAKTGAKLDPRTGVELPPKEKPMTMKQMFAQPKQPKLTLDDVWRKVEDVVSRIFPDGDPKDHLAPWLEKHGIRDFKIGEILDRAAKKNGYKDLYDYWESMGDLPLSEQGVAEGAAKGRVPKLPRRHFFDTYGGPGNGIAYTDNTHWWKIVDGKVVDFTNSYEGTGEWKRDFVARQRQQGVSEGKEDYSAKKARAGQDIGKPGKQFAKIAKGAAEKYGSEEKGKKVAGAVLKKLRNSQKESIEEGFMDSVKSMFGKKPTAKPSMGQQSSSTSSNMDIDLSADPNREPYRFMRVPSNASRDIIKSKFRTLAKKYHPDMQGGNSDIMAKLNTAMARIAYNMGVPRLEEVDLPSNQMDMGAGLGAGRSSVRLESKKAKPDFLDLDKDKNKKESMAKAAKDAKKKKKVTESSHRHSAAKLLGKSHALAKEGYNCRFEDMDEAKMYHEGYKEGLDECYGQGVYEMAAMPASVPAMANAAMPSMEEDMFDEGFMDSVKGMFGKKPTTAPSTGKSSRTRLPDSPFELDDYPFPKGPATQLPPGYIPPRSPHQGEPSTAFRGPMMPDSSQVKADADLMDYTLAREGNAFTGALANTPKGGKFSLGGKTFTDTSDLDEMSLAFESLDKQLKSLLESEEVSEGMTVSISKGQQGAPDSVSVTAQDAEADQLLGLIKHAGLGLFGDDQQSGYGATDSVAQDHGDIKVVGDHDGMMSIMKKISGIEDSSNDYEDEESHGHDEHDQSEEEVCETCNEAQCQCETEEPIQEVETEDQMAFNVSEDDSEEKETTANEDAEAEEDKALAMQNSEDDEEEEEEKVDESYANSDDDTFEADINFMTKAISGGLDKQKSTGQTTIPVIAGQNDRMGYSTNESIGDWKKLAGIK